MTTETIVTKKQPWHGRAWSLPWVVLFLALYAFALPWMYGEIVDRYYVRRAWNSALPGLGTTPARRICMGTHMGFGAAALLLGPTQFVPSSLRARSPALHRLCGRLYVLCALGASVFGLAFIVLKRGILSGGINMAAAFASAGTTFGLCAVAAYVEARARRWESHRAWTVRSFSQVLSPTLYRYWYFAADAVGLYPAGEYDPARDCDPATGICPVFLRPFDAVHCWTYWLSSLIVAELIIRFLPPLETTEGEKDDNKSEPKGRDEEKQPLFSSKGVENYYSSVSTQIIKSDEDEANIELKPYSALGLNSVGTCLAVVTSVLTVKMFVP